MNKATESQTLLVIEDNPRHLNDVKSVLDDLLSQLTLKVRTVFATNLVEANGHFSDADLIMTDIFFPDQQGGDAEIPNGQKILEQCIAEKKPGVWVTSTYHHGKKTSPLFHWGHEKGFAMFDSGSFRDRDGESDKKSWDRALRALFYTSVGLNHDLLRYTEDGLHELMDEDDPWVSSENNGERWRLVNGGIDQSYFPELVSERRDDFQWDKNRQAIVTKMLELGFPIQKSQSE